MKKRRPAAKLHKPKCSVVFKVIYPTKKAALTAINKNEREGLTHYKCPHCKQYHLTSQKGDQTNEPRTYV